MQGDFFWLQTPYAYFGARILLGLKNNEFWKILISVMLYIFYDLLEESPKRKSCIC